MAPFQLRTGVVERVQWTGSITSAEVRVPDPNSVQDWLFKNSGPDSEESIPVQPIVKNLLLLYGQGGGVLLSVDSCHGRFVSSIRVVSRELTNAQNVSRLIGILKFCSVTNCSKS